MRCWQLAREKAFNTKTSNAKIYVSGAESVVDTHRCPSAQERERPISNRKAKIEEEEKAGKQKQGNVKHGDRLNSVSYETIVSGLCL